MNKQDIYELRKDSSIVIKTGIYTIATGGLLGYISGDFEKEAKEISDGLITAGLAALSFGAIVYILPGIAAGLGRIINNKSKSLEDKVEQ